jgi:hypothetical protein
LPLARAPAGPPPLALPMGRPVRPPRHRGDGARPLVFACGAGSFASLCPGHPRGRPVRPPRHRGRGGAGRARSVCVRRRPSRLASPWSPHRGSAGASPAPSGGARPLAFAFRTGRPASLGPRRPTGSAAATPLGVGIAINSPQARSGVPRRPHRLASSRVPWARAKTLRRQADARPLRLGALARDLLPRGAGPGGCKARRRPSERPSARWQCARWEPRHLGRLRDCEGRAGRERPAGEAAT